MAYSEGTGAGNAGNYGKQKEKIINMRQISKYQNGKALFEINDGLKRAGWDDREGHKIKDCFAKIHAHYSGFRIAAKDYSAGTGEKAVNTEFRIEPETMRLIAEDVRSVYRLKREILVRKSAAETVLKAASETRKAAETKAGAAYAAHARVAEVLSVRMTGQAVCLAGFRTADAGTPAQNAAQEAGKRFAAEITAARAEERAAAEALRAADADLASSCAAEGAAFTALKCAEAEEAKLTGSIFYSQKIAKDASKENPGYSNVSSAGVEYNAAMKLPWTLTVENGIGIREHNSTGGYKIKSGSYKKSGSVRLFLSDGDVRKLFFQAEAYLAAWENGNWASAAKQRSEYERAERAERAAAQPAGTDPSLR